MSEFHKKKKNAHIGLAVMAALLVLGWPFFDSSSEALWTAFGMAATAAGFVVLFILNEREYRADSRHDDRS